MSATRPAPFRRALSDLRERLRDGRLPPGARILAADVAAELKLSQTPVREALSRLAGEGLLEERRGEGVFVRRLSRSDIADLYRLNLAHLLIALEPGRPLRRPVAPPDAAALELDPVAATERLLMAWMMEAASGALLLSFRSAQFGIGAVRRLEAAVMPDLPAEAVALGAASLRPSRTDWLDRLRAFHLRRIAAADDLAVLLERGSVPATIDGI